MLRFNIFSRKFSTLPIVINESNTTNKLIDLVRLTIIIGAAYFITDNLMTKASNIAEKATKSAEAIADKAFLSAKEVATLSKPNSLERRTYQEALKSNSAIIGEGSVTGIVNALSNSNSLFGWLFEEKKDWCPGVKEEEDPSKEG